MDAHHHHDLTLLPSDGDDAAVVVVAVSLSSDAAVIVLDDDPTPPAEAPLVLQVECPVCYSVVEMNEFDAHCASEECNGNPSVDALDKQAARLNSKVNAVYYKVLPFIDTMDYFHLDHFIRVARASIKNQDICVPPPFIVRHLIARIMQDPEPQLILDILFSEYSMLTTRPNQPMPFWIMEFFQEFLENSLSCSTPNQFCIVKLFCVFLASNFAVQLSEGWDVRDKSWMAITLKLYLKKSKIRPQQVLSQLQDSALVLQTRLESLDFIQLGRALDEFVTQFAIRCNMQLSS
eukprot:TRINITY_DN14121_c0_g2_i4.p1 TRINITY_DN14121_c0_g2~~TRINITY_DN14121_c0_g2_i4.p1  ORF type:complete len:291 (-),score=73.08 TRINITY_DN14121_c0_g2_i4:340-1212(-)